jgi:secondary thiamine-phosphate synthase enzyme
MHIALARLSIKTAPRELREITAEIARWVELMNYATGLVSIYIQHTAASLLIHENASQEVRRDLEAFFCRLVPEDISLYRHDDEGPDDMPARVKSALTRTELTVPVIKGQLQLGTLAGDFLFEHRAPPHSRVLILTLIWRGNTGSSPSLTPFARRYLPHSTDFRMCGARWPKQFLVNGMRRNGYERSLMATVDELELAADFARREINGVYIRIGGSGFESVDKLLEMPGSHILGGDRDDARARDRAAHGAAARWAKRGARHRAWFRVRLTEPYEDAAGGVVFPEVNVSHRHRRAEVRKRQQVLGHTRV